MRARGAHPAAAVIRVCAHNARARYWHSGARGEAQKAGAWHDGQVRHVRASAKRRRRRDGGGK